MPLREKRRSHYWADHLPGRLCVRSVSLRQSIIKRIKQAGLSYTTTDSVSMLECIGSHWTRFHFEESRRDYPYCSLKKDGGIVTMNCTELREEKIRSLPDTRTVGCLPYRRTLSGFRAAECKHFSSLPPSLTRLAVLLARSRAEKLRLVSKIKPRQWRYVALNGGRCRKRWLHM